MRYLILIYSEEPTEPAARGAARSRSARVPRVHGHAP